MDSVEAGHDQERYWDTATEHWETEGANRVSGY